MKTIFIFFLSILLTPVCMAKVNKICDQGRNYCVAVGSEIFGSPPDDGSRPDLRVGYSEDGGKTWIRGTLDYVPSFSVTTYQLSDLVCAENLERCAATFVGVRQENDETAIIVMTRDSGKTWLYSDFQCASDWMLDAINELHKIVCHRNFDECFAIGKCTTSNGSDDFKKITHNLILYTQNGGRCWQVSRTPPKDQGDYNAITDATCQSYECHATGDASKDGKSWNTAYLSYNLGIDWQQTNQNPSFNIGTANTLQK